MSDWRIGHIKNPCSFKPAQDYSWHNRFDDLLRVFRTIYCAREKITCFREMLADFRPNTKAVNEFEKLFHEKPQSLGVVLEEWYEKHVLVEVKIWFLKGSLIDIESPAELKRLSSQHYEFLKQSGITNLSVKALRSKDRRFTQYLSRIYYDAGKAGIQFRSHLDSEICTALFEKRAHLKQINAVIPIDPYMEEFVDVCEEFGLKIV